ncbi:MAG: RNA polymerase sigma factor region1.1 domain-containing protein, partial [Solirubrobacterales bacterium]
MAEKAEVLLTDEGDGPGSTAGASGPEQAEASLPDSEDLRGLILQGRERGYLTFEEISGALEEVEVTKEQVRDLHTYLIEHGVDVIAE